MNFYYNVTEAQVATSKERIEVANKNIFLLQHYLKFVVLQHLSQICCEIIQCNIKNSLIKQHLEKQITQHHKNSYCNIIAGIVGVHPGVELVSIDKLAISDAMRQGWTMVKK